MSCTAVETTSVLLNIGTNCTRLYSKVIGLDNIIPRSDHKYNYYSWDSFYIPSQPPSNKDVLMFLMGVNYNNTNNEPNGSYAMTVSIASVHLHHVLRQMNSSSNCDFAPGDVGNTFYTRVDCSLSRLQSIPNEDNIAFPNSFGVNQISMAYTQYFQARFSQESTSDSPITMIKPHELIRFYQVYLIVKDIQYRQPVTRRLHVEVKIVQLLTAFLVVYLLVMVLCILGMVRYGFVAYVHQNTILATPQSKLDWMLQSIEPYKGGLSSRHQSHRRSVTLKSDLNLGMLPRAARRQQQFEAARYATGDEQSWENGPATEYNHTYSYDDKYTAIGQPKFTATTSSKFQGKTPYLSIDLADDDFFSRVSQGSFDDIK